MLFLLDLLCVIRWGLATVYDNIDHSWSWDHAHWLEWLLFTVILQHHYASWNLPQGIEKKSTFPNSKLQNTFSIERVYYSGQEIYGNLVI